MEPSGRQLVEWTDGAVAIDPSKLTAYAAQHPEAKSTIAALSGLEPVPGDELIAARGRAYEYSCAQRGGSGCPVAG